jgi:hypothetical protein
MIPKFDTVEQRLEWLKVNKSLVIASKKSQIKYGEAVEYSPDFIGKSGEVSKANEPVEEEEIDAIRVKVVINCCNWLDTYYDVHIAGCWKKTLKENRSVMHIQEHRMQFDKIISDGGDLKAFTENVTWSELGYKFEGDAECLIFDSVVREERNEQMFKEYRKGRVKNHSVGMHYVSMYLGVNSEDPYWKDEYKVWKKYRPMIVNGEKADELGYFFAVTEARLVEGSAVPIGANVMTPTLDNNLKGEPDTSTPKEPDTSTLKRENVIKTLRNFKFN